MRILRLLSGALLVLCAAGVAQADSVPLGDPKIILAGAGASTQVGELFSFSSQDFIFPYEGDPFIDFQNVSGVSFDELKILFLNVSFPGNTSCEVFDFYTTCLADPNGSFVQFFGQNGDNLTGIPTALFDGEFAFGGDFRLTFVGFPTDQTIFFEGRANAIPEPASIFLCLVAAGAIATQRRLRRVAKI